MPLINYPAFWDDCAEEVKQAYMESGDWSNVVKERILEDLYVIDAYRHLDNLGYYVAREDFHVVDGVFVHRRTHGYDLYVDGFVQRYKTEYPELSYIGGPTGKNRLWWSDEEHKAKVDTQNLDGIQIAAVNVGIEAVTRVAHTIYDQYIERILTGIQADYNQRIVSREEAKRFLGIWYRLNEDATRTN